MNEQTTTEMIHFKKWLAIRNEPCPNLKQDHGMPAICAPKIDEFSRKHMGSCLETECMRMKET